jgi:hypothetical protein
MKALAFMVHLKMFCGKFMASSDNIDGNITKLACNLVS